MEQRATAESVITALWQQAANGGSPAGQPVRSDPALVKRLAQTLGEQSLRCISDALGGNREQLAQASATVLETLLALWSARGLSPDEIWIELHKREQLGSLLMQLNQAQSQAPRRLLKPWRVDSTKLP